MGEFLYADTCNIVQWQIKDFSDGDANQPLRVGGSANLLVAKFSSKLHENEENWTERELRPKFVKIYVDLPLFFEKLNVAQELHW